jgi:hypothetical protein
VRIRRTTAALALAAAVIVPAATTATTAYASSHSQQSHKPAKVAFTATGTITAVDTAAGSVTVAAKGGTKDVRGKTVTITVGANARVFLNGKRKALSELAAGNRITVLGVRQSTGYNALQIVATAPKAKPSPQPAPSASAPAPSDDATPEPSDDSSHSPAV